MPQPNDASASERRLIDAAIAASKHAYIPYSQYRVGAALETNDGEVYGGCNIECVSFTPTVCAERTALFKAVSDGLRDFSRIAVVTRNAGSPCGVCRQALYEFAPDMQVLLADLEGALHLRTTVRELLPHGFGPVKLED